MPKDTGTVEVPVKLKVDGDIDLTAAQSGMQKSIHTFTSAFQKTLDKVSKSTLGRSIGALFGKDVTSDLIKSIQEDQKYIQDLEQEYAALEKRSTIAENKMNDMRKQGISKVKDYKEALQKLNEEEAKLPAQKSKAQQRYASNLGAATRAKDPAKKDKALQRANLWKQELDRINQAMSPESQADRDKTKKFYEGMIKNGGVSPKDMRDLQKEQSFAQQGMASNKDVIGATSKDIKKKQTKVTILSMLGKVGDAFRKFGAGVGNIGKSIVGEIGGPMNQLFSKKQSKRITSFGKFGLKSANMFSRGFKNLSKNIMTFGLGFRSAYYLIKSMRNLVIKDLAIMASKFDELNKPLSKLLTSFNQLKGAIGTAFQPIVTAITPALQQLMTYLSSAAEKVGEFFAVMTGQKYIYKAKANQKDFASTLLGTEKLADYDQLKVVGDSQDIDYEKVEVSTSNISANAQKLMSAIQSFMGAMSTLYDNVISPMIGELSPILSDFITSTLPEIARLITAIVTALAPYIPKIADIISDIVLNLSPVLVDIVEDVLPAIGSIIDFLEKAVDELLPPIVKILEETVEPIIDDISEFISDKLMPKLTEIVDYLGPKLDDFAEWVDDNSDSIIRVLEWIMNILILISVVIKVIHNPIALIAAGLLGIIDSIRQIESGEKGISVALELIISILSIGAAIAIMIGGWIPLIIAAIVAVVALIAVYWDEIVAWFKDLWAKFLEFAKTAIGKVGEFFTNLWEGLKLGFKTVINWISSKIESLINGIIKVLNIVIGALNTIQFTFPDWVPELGGKTFGINIPLVKNVSIPKLAQGAVIPPNSEFLAMLGDQKKGTNIEAPLDTIKQALVEALAQYGGAKEPIVLRLNGKDIAEVVWSEEDKRYKQTGKLAYSY